MAGSQRAEVVKLNPQVVDSTARTHTGSTEAISASSPVWPRTCIPHRPVECVHAYIAGVNVGDGGDVERGRVCARARGCGCIRVLVCMRVRV